MQRHLGILTVRCDSVVAEVTRYPGAYDSY